MSTPRILLFGMMDSGKTTVGRLLAERLGVPFAHNDGLAAPSAAEVVSMPASAVLHPEVRERLRAAGTLVWLREKATEHTPLFAEVAVHTVDVDDLPPWRIVQRILDVLGLGVFGWLPGSFSGVVLDLDGLLVDTEVIWLEGKRQLYAARGIPFSIEDHHAVLGTSEEYTAQVFARRFGLGEEDVDSVRDDYLARVEKLFEGGIALRPGAIELVGSLRGRVPLGLASNTRRRLVELVLERTGLAGCFDAIVTAGDAPAKPDPGLYLAACRLLDVDPASSVAVEDSPTGARAALAAGLTTIGVPSDAEIALPPVHRIVASLTELIEPAAA